MNLGPPNAVLYLNSRMMAPSHKKGPCNVGFHGGPPRCSSWACFFQREIHQKWGKL